MILRPGHTNDLVPLQQLYVATIREVCKDHYNKAQIKVWTSGIQNTQRWHDMLTQQWVRVAQDGDRIIGFITLDRGNYIDFLYVHKDYQKQGVAYTLYNLLEAEALRLGQAQLTSDISITARPFFEKLGFRVITQQAIERQGVTLTNYKMAKTLKPRD